MTAIDFMIAALATWRVAALLVREDGPFDVFAHLRRLLGAGMAGRVLDCFYCTSLWVAAPAAVWLVGLSGRLLVVWLAVSGAAGLLERLVTPPVVEQPIDLEEASARFNRRRHYV
jgi:hypothetical protein